MAKSKIKPHKGLKKRVKVTGSGKVTRRKANKGHLMTGKPGSRRRQLGRPGQVDKSDETRIKRMLGLK